MATPYPTASMPIAFSRMKLTSGRLSGFDPHRNGITAARLLLALAVIVSHSVRIGGFGPEPLTDVGQFSLGFGAVIGFFALSGFLLARSRERTPTLAFIRNRALRILPGYWLALLFAAFVAAPIGANLMGESPDPISALAYVGSNGALLVTGQEGIAPAFERINGSLWTLSIEAGGYLLLAVIPARFVRAVASAELGLLLGAWAICGEWIGGYGTLLFLAFTFGICAWHWRAHIPISIASLASGAVVAAAAFALDLTPIAAIAIGYAALGLAWLPIHLDRDLSYGVYVFAYPLQEVLALAAVPSFGLWMMVGVTVALVVPLAFLSWTFVERPALKLRRYAAVPTPMAQALQLASATDRGR